MSKGKESISLGACVNYSRDELKRKEPGFHVGVLVGWLREVSGQIRDHSIARNGYRSAFADILQKTLGMHLNLSCPEDSLKLADKIDEWIGQVVSDSPASVGVFLDALCSSAGKTYDRGCPIVIAF